MLHVIWHVEVVGIYPGAKALVVYVSRVYSDFCLHLAPYRMTNNGMGASTKQAPANTVNPHPYPIASVSGSVTNGKKVPIKHRVISTAVIADAEYKLKASTTYAMTGTIPSSTQKPIRTTARSRMGAGRWSCALQP